MRRFVFRATKALLSRLGLRVSRIRPNDIADYLRLYPGEAVRERRFYNIGSGDFDHPCWTNLDKPSAWYGAMQAQVVVTDLLAEESLPIERGAAEIIYTSHTVEHLPDSAVHRLFRNAFDALKPGGILRVTCPDADLLWRALATNDADWFFWDEDASARFDAHYRSIHREPPNSRPISERWLHQIASQLAVNDLSPSETKLADTQIREIIGRLGPTGAMNYLTNLCAYSCERVGNHISWWNAGKLINALEGAGFTKVERSGYLQSAAHILRNPVYFDTRPQMSVFVEAVR